VKAVLGTEPTEELREADWWLAAGISCDSQGVDGWSFGLSQWLCTSGFAVLLRSSQIKTFELRTIWKVKRPSRNII
jgi:hypothetical protein